MVKSSLWLVSNSKILEVGPLGQTRSIDLPSQKAHDSDYTPILYRVILSVLDPRKCEYLKDCSLDFEHAYMTTYLAS